jgi:hypothetical protein
MTVWPPRGSATLLLWLGLPLVAAACSFSSPDGGSGGGDGDGGIDAAPACPDGDDDGDTACNTVDKCVGHDDRLDADGDAISDGCDDWPCGVKPGDPGEAMGDSGGEGRNWGATFINIGMDRRVVVNAGQPFGARFVWSLFFDCGGVMTSCQAQVEIGYGATRTGCLFDGSIMDERLVSGGFNNQVLAPATSGAHELRLNAGRGTACGASLQPFYGGDPGPGSTIAVVCVR